MLRYSYECYDIKVGKLFNYIQLLNYINDKYLYCHKVITQIFCMFNY